MKFSEDRVCARTASWLLFFVVLFTFPLRLGLIGASLPSLCFPCRLCCCCDICWSSSASPASCFQASLKSPAAPRGRSLMMTDSKRWPRILGTDPDGTSQRVPGTVCQNSAGPGLSKRLSVAESRRRDGCLTQEHNGPLMAPEDPAFLFNLKHVGRFGLMAPVTVVGTLRLMKANETARCSQRPDTGHGSNPATY